MISKLNTLKPNTKLKLCMSEKLSTYNKKKDRELIKKGRRRSPTLKLSIFPHAPFVPTSLFPVMHPGGEVNFRKRGSKFFLPLSHRHQTLHLVHILPLTSPSSLLASTHTHTHAPNPWSTLEWKSSLHKGVYMLSSRELLEGVEFRAGQVCKEPVVLHWWEV